MRLKYKIYFSAFYLSALLRKFVAVIETSHKAVQISNATFEQSKESILLLSFSVQSISVAVFHEPSNQIKTWEKYIYYDVFDADQLAGKISKMLETEAHLTYTYQKIYIQVCTMPYVLIPETFYNTADALEYIKLHKADIFINAQTDKLSSLNTYAIYSLGDRVQKLALEKYPVAVVSHSSTKLIERLCAQNINKKEAQLFVHVIDNTVQEIIGIKEGKLFFHNFFEFKTSEDFLYYILAVMEQCSLSNLNTPIILLGDVLKNSPIYDLCTKYIRNIRFVEPINKISISEGFENLLPHQYFALTCQFI